MNEVLQKYIDTIPVIKDALGLDIMMSITDGYKFLGYWRGDKIVADIHVGDELSHQDPMWQVFQSGKKIESVMPADVYGFEFKAIMIPIFDGRTVVGTMGIAISLENETFTNNTSIELLENIDKAKENMDDMSSRAEAVTEKSRVLEDTTGQLVASIDAIHKFVNNINNISNQTNMLALNASIEAARSGAAGAGFAVVAKSMGSLSADTKNAANQILSLLTELDEGINNMKHAITESSEVQAAQVEDTEKLLEKINEIETLTKKLAGKAK